MLLVSCDFARVTATPTPFVLQTPPVAAAPSFVPVSTPNPTPTPTAASRIVGFRDPVTGDSLAIELGPTAPDRGHFSVTVAKGVYAGDEVRATLSSRSAPMQVTYDGDMEFIDTASSATRTATVSLRGTLDPDAHAADITFTVDGKPITIAARPPDSRSVAGTLDRMESALIADDPIALYAVTSQAVHDNYTSAQFVDAWQAQAAATGRRITAMRRQSIGPVTESDLGFATVEVRYSADVSDRGGSRVAGYVVLLIFESGEWRLWSTSEN